MEFLAEFELTVPGGDTGVRCQPPRAQMAEGDANLPTDTRRSGWADSWLRMGGHEISGSADMTSPGHA